MRAPLRPGPALALLAALAAAALLAEHWQVPAAIAVALLCICLRAPAGRRRPYLVGCALTAGAVLLVTPLVLVDGAHVLWSGPVVPVLGQLDVTSEELAAAGLQAIRLSAVTLAFAVYALLIDHDALLRSARFARRSALVVALATRLLPTLERDAHGLVEALRGRGVEVTGVRGRARLLSPLVSGSLERALNLAEAMEARGFGSAGGTRAPAPRWRSLDRLALTAALVVAVGALWL
jgi:energy-coupling factor transport system permease protein